MPRWHKLAAYFLIANTIGAFGIVSRLYYGEWSGGFSATTKLGVFLNLLSMVLSAALFARGLSRTGRLSTGAVLVLVMACFFLGSMAWSIDPSTTFRRGVLYVMFALGAIGIAMNLDADEFVGAVAAICFASAVASLVLLAVAPASAWMPGDDPTGGARDLRGIFTHKNVLGRVMAEGALATAHLMRSGGISRFRGLVLSGTILFVAVLSHSLTSLLVVLYLYGVSWLVVLFRRGGAARVMAMAMLLLLIPAVATVNVFPDFFLASVGKDPTLSGRTELWAIVIDEIHEQPLTGWGFFAFWGPANPLAESISEAVGWTVPHAHNGLLEMLLEVGILGTALILTILIRNVMIAWRSLRTPARELGVSVLLCCGAIVFEGVSEEVILDSSEPLAGCFFIFGLLCESALLMARQQHYLVADEVFE